MEKSSKRNKQAAPPVEMARRGRAAAIGGDAGFAAGAAFQRAGFKDPSLVLHWREIAGPEIARIARPLRLQETPTGGVLTLLAEPGAALFLGHDARALAARINAYLGRPAVLRVKFVQGALSAPQPKARLFRPAPAPKVGDPVHTYEGPESLKKALASLARWRTGR